MEQSNGAHRHRDSLVVGAVVALSLSDRGESVARQATLDGETVQTSVRWRTPVAFGRPACSR